MSPTTKTVLFVTAGLVIVVILLNSQKRAAIGGTTNREDSSTAKSFFDFGAAVFNTAGKIIGPSNHPSDVDGPEDEYMGEGGYDTSGFRVYND